MKRTLKSTLAVLLCATVLQIGVLNANAAQSVTVNIPDFDVKLNGTLLNEVNANYPVIIYKDITYFPMTFNDSAYLGISSNWTAEDGLNIRSGNQPAPKYSSYTDRINDKNANYTASIVTSAVTVNGKKTDNSKEEYPLLLFRDITYFPLTWRFAVDEFGWDYKFTQEEGLEIVSENGQKDDVENMLSVLNKAFYRDDYIIRLEFLKPYQPVSARSSFIHSFNVKNRIDGNISKTIFTRGRQNFSTIFLENFATALKPWEWETNIGKTDYADYNINEPIYAIRGSVAGPPVSADIFMPAALWELTGSRKENIESITKLDTDADIERYEIKFKDDNKLFKFYRYEHKSEDDNELIRCNPDDDKKVEDLSMIVSIDKAENELISIKYTFNQVQLSTQKESEFELDITFLEDLE